MKFSIIGYGIRCINFLSLKILYIICSKLVKIIVVNKYCMLCWVISVIIIMVMVLVVLEIIFGWLLIVEVIKFIMKVV